MPRKVKKITITAEIEAAKRLLREIPNTKQGFNYQGVTPEGKAVFCNGKVWLLLNEPSPAIEQGVLIDDWLKTSDGTKYNYCGLTPQDKTIIDIFANCNDSVGDITPEQTKVWTSSSNPVRLDLNRHYGFIPFLISGRCYNAKFFNDALYMVCDKITEKAELFLNKKDNLSPLVISGSKGKAFILPIRIRKDALKYYFERTKEVNANEG